MEIIKKKVEELIPANYNPRKISREELDNLKNSIKKFGYVEPIIWNKTTNHVVGGHQRLVVMKEMGYSEVDVVVIEIPLEREKALNIALNKISGDWDLQKLVPLLNEVKSIDLSLFNDTGFSDRELKDFAKLREEELRAIEAEQEITPDEFDLAKSYREPKYQVHLGEIYEMGNQRLMCGDATDPDDVAKLIGTTKVTMAFCDPPYGVGYEYESHDDNVKYEDYKEFCRKWLTILKKYASFIIITSGHKNKRLYYELDNSLNEMVWNKRFGNTHGFVTHTMITEPMIVYGKVPVQRYNTDYFEFMTDRVDGLREEHPCPKPMGLIKALVLPQTNEGDVIVDLFGGSGTTLIVAEQMKRGSRVMEIDPKYCSTIIDRWEKLTGRKAIKLEGKNASSQEEAGRVEAV